MARSRQGLSCETFDGGEPVAAGADGDLDVATAATVGVCSIPDSGELTRGGDDGSGDTEAGFA